MKLIRLLLAAAPLALAACNSNDAPTGQVAATVDGEEITVSEIGAELSSSGVPANAQDKELTNRALDAVVNRKILAAEARERGLDKTPAGALAVQRAQDIALSELLRADIQGAATTPSDDEARQFIEANPSMFANRFVSVVEQVVVPQMNRLLLQRLEAADTLEQIRAVLDGANVRYQTTMGGVDSLTLPPQAAAQIAKLGVGEVYIIPQGDGARINAIVSRKTYPIAGDESLRLARELLAQQRTQGQAQGAFRTLLTEKKADVRYGEGFAAPRQPGATPPAGGAGAPARPGN